MPFFFPLVQNQACLFKWLVPAAVPNHTLKQIPANVYLFFPDRGANAVPTTEGEKKKQKKTYHTVNKTWSQQSVAVAAAAHYRARYFVHLSAPHCPQEVRH